MKEETKEETLEHELWRLERNLSDLECKDRWSLEDFEYFDSLNRQIREVKKKMEDESNG